jgi:hypothetical protein
MNRTRLLSLVCVGLLISSLVVAGCIRDRADRGAATAVPPQLTTPVAAAQSPVTAAPAASQEASRSTTAKTCAALGGDTCSPGEDCTGSWLNAQDSFSCCSVTCAGPSGSGAVVTIAPFETPASLDELESITP